MPDPIDPWPERIRATTSGVKDVLLALAAIATIWIQRGNEGKLDAAAAKTEVVKEKLDASTEARDVKLDIIAKHSANADQKIGDWRHDYEKPREIQPATVAPPPP